MSKVRINIGYFCKKFGEKGAIRFAKSIGANAVDFDLLGYDASIPGNLYTRSDEERSANPIFMKKILKSNADLRIFFRN